MFEVDADRDVEDPSWVDARGRARAVHLGMGDLDAPEPVGVARNASKVAIELRGIGVPGRL